jgi:long-chain acyl-CoA synthetase
MGQRKKKNGEPLQEMVITSPEVVEKVKKHVDKVNASLASYEQIKKFAVLAKQFSVDEGEMTPTLKIKRNVIELRYKEVIEQLYD